MSTIIVNQLNKFNNYKFDLENKRIENLKDITDADIDELLEISNILDSNFINYEFTQNIDFKIIK